MPGTHDSFSYVSLPFASNLVDSYYITQTLDIPGQLQAGIRHFDMRTLLLQSGPSSNNAPGALPFSGPGYYMAVHSLDYTGVRLENVLDQMSSFLDAHPKEIIILHFAGNVQSGPPTYQTSSAFEAVLDQHLRRASDGASYIYDAQTACNLAGPPWNVLTPAGPYFPTAQYAGYCQSPSGVGVGVLPQEVTPQQLYTTSARVIAVEEFGLTGSGYLGQLDSARLTWPDWTYQPQSAIPPFFVERLRGYYDPAGGPSAIDLLDTWMEQGTPDGLLGLYGTRPAGAGYESDTEFLTLQAELTPGGADFASNVYGAAPPLVQAGQGGENAHLATLLGTTWTPYSVNVVQVDFANYCFDQVSNSCLGIIPNVASAIINFNNQTFGRVSFGTLGASQISVGHDGSVYTATGTTYGGSGVLGQSYVLAKRVANTGLFTDWQSLNAAGNRIAADPNGGVWVLDNSGSYVTHFNADLAPVAKVSAPSIGNSPETMKDIAVDNTGTLYALSGFSFSGTLITAPVQYSNGQWVGVGNGFNGNANRIAANSSVVAVLDTNGNIQQYAGSNWTPLSQPFTATSVAVDDAGHVWATQAEQATGAYPGYTPVPTSSVWGRISSPFGAQWQQYRTEGVQVGVGTSAPALTPGSASGTDTLYVTDKTGHTHSLTFGVPTGPNQGQAPPPKRYAPQITVGGLTFNHATQLFGGTLTVTNNTGSDITDQLAVLFNGLPSNVTIANNPLTYQGEPFVLMPPGTLKAGASVSMQIQFRNPDLTQITYSNIVYAYVPGN